MFLIKYKPIRNVMRNITTVQYSTVLLTTFIE